MIARWTMALSLGLLLSSVVVTRFIVMRCAVSSSSKAAKLMRRRRTSMSSRKRRKNASRIWSRRAAFCTRVLGSCRCWRPAAVRALSYRKIASKKGEAAYAASYLVAQLYLADSHGVEKMVWDQFEEDFCGLRDTAQALNTSWKQTGAIHAQLKQFANKSVLASVDPEFVSALVDQAPAQSGRIVEILNNSRTVNDAP